MVFKVIETHENTTVSMSQELLNLALSSKLVVIDFNVHNAIGVSSKIRIIFCLV